MFFPLLKLTLILLLIFFSLGSTAVWLLPVELIQDWAYRHAPADQYARYEAIGMAEAAWWGARFALPLVSVMTCLAIFQIDRFARLISDASTRFMKVTSTGDWRGQALRCFLVAWLLIAGYRGAWGLSDRARDWTYFRWNSGDSILPNISDSNRQVIRYLQQVTPADSRILVLSDQKLFFLSYYLLPRRLEHPIHAGSEFVIPLANNARQLSAYRLAELNAADIARWHPDYILEYFEGSEYVEDSLRGADADWVKFWQVSNQTSELPPYVVILKKSSPQGEP